MHEYPKHIAELSSFRKFIQRIESAWPEFRQRRSERLAQVARNGAAPEKLAEDILSDFFTIALDWDLGDLNNQLQYADIVLTKSGLKRLLIEAKHPGSLDAGQSKLQAALHQARGYADQQRVQTVAISDGCLFYAADIVNGGFRDRAWLRLDDETFSADSWWVSVDGIYRPPEILAVPSQTRRDPSAASPVVGPPGVGEIQPPAAPLLHPQHGRPASCFAYVGDALRTSTWKLPYRFADGRVDAAHLSGAIRAVVSNYRGARVKTIPEAALSDVLVRLGKAAAELRKMPTQCPKPQLSYQQLYQALQQLGRLNEVFGCDVPPSGKPFPATDP